MNNVFEIKKSECPFCELEGSIEYIEKAEDVVVRGSNISVTKVSRRCTSCGAEFENTKDHDWKGEAFNKYRAIMGIPTPSEIKTWRESFSLTQGEVSSLLGWGDATIGRYEKGSLPTDAQSDQLKGIMAEDGLLRAIEEKPEAISPAKRDALIEKIKPIAIINDYKRVIHDIYSNTNEMLNGGTQFAFERAAGLISILSENKESITKFNKLMFYADFLSKHLLGRSISGIQYARINFGPVPENYETLYECMKSVNVIEIEEVFFDTFPAKLISSVERSFRDHLSAEEVEIAVRVREYFSKFTAKRIVEYSHKEAAWIEVGQRMPIPYSYAEKISIKEIMG